MINVDNWNYYYNIQGNENIRANLVYTPLVSPDRKQFCMWFYRDDAYHFDKHINSMWNEDLLENRFRKELKYQKIAQRYVPTLEILDVDESSRKIIIEWPNDDFYMSCLTKTPDQVFPGWKYQMQCVLKKLWSNNVVKLSLHPNSWVIKDDLLVPFNWFFSYDKETDTDNLQDLIIQISDNRLEKVYEIFASLGFHPEKNYKVTDLQRLALHSFKSNYDPEFIDQLIKTLNLCSD